MNAKPFVLLVLVLGTAGWGLGAQDSTPGELGTAYYKKLGILEVAESAAPYFPFQDRVLMFSYVPGPKSINAAFRDGPARPRLVAVAFGHEQYRNLHVMSVNEAGVYIYLWELTREVHEDLAKEGKDLEYRLVVDGVWMADPANVQGIRKYSGSTVSVVSRASFPVLAVQSPAFVDEPARGGKTPVRLHWEGKPGQEIFVAGTFNGFDPYLHIMREVERPGLYQVDLRLLPGQYFYYFVVDGVRQLDPLNASQGHDASRNLFSRLDIPR